MENNCLIDTNILSHYLNTNPNEAEKHKSAEQLFDYLNKNKYTIYIPSLVIFEILQCSKAIEVYNDMRDLIDKSFICLDFNTKAAFLPYSIRNGKLFDNSFESRNDSKYEIKIDMMIVATAIAFDIKEIISEDNDIKSIVNLLSKSGHCQNLSVKTYSDYPFQMKITF